MKITYITNAIIPSEKAHSYQIIKMCEAFAKNRMKIDLILPSFSLLNKTVIQTETIWQYYGIEDIFKIQKMPYLVWINSYYSTRQFLRFLVQVFFFTIFFIFYSLVNKPEKYYVRDPFWTKYLNSLRFIHRGKIYYEGHKPQPQVVKLLSSGAIDGLIVNTNQLKNYYLTRGVHPKKIFVAGNGVDLKMFKNLAPKINLKNELKIPLGKKVVCYTGHLYNWKGVKILALAMKDFKDDDVVCYFVGGLEKDIIRFKNFIKKNNIPNTTVVGHVSPVLIPKYQIVSDVLVLPNLKGGESRFSSPMKLFEYMASKRPIVAPDIPTIRELLNEKNSILVKPNNPEALTKGIKLVLNDKKLSEKLSKNAYYTVKKYDWNNRAKNIIKFIEDN